MPPFLDAYADQCYHGSGICMHSAVVDIMVWGWMLIGRDALTDGQYDDGWVGMLLETEALANVRHNMS